MSRGGGGGGGGGFTSDKRAGTKEGQDEGEQVDGGDATASRPSPSSLAGAKVRFNGISRYVTGAGGPPARTRTRTRARERAAAAFRCVSAACE